MHLKQRDVPPLETYHSSDPLACVDGRVEDHSFLRPLTAGTPDMNTGNRAALDRGAGGDDLGIVGVLRYQITHELQMVGVRMVGVEEGDIGGSKS